MTEMEGAIAKAFDETQNALRVSAPASAMSVADSAGLFAATDVEGALQESLLTTLFGPNRIASGESVLPRHLATSTVAYGTGSQRFTMFTAKKTETITQMAAATSSTPAATATTIAAGSDGAELPQSTINVASTTGFAASGTMTVVTASGPQTVTYTGGGGGGTSFTGCSGGAGVMSTGGAVRALTYCAFGIYSVAGDGTVALLASTASDTSVGAAVDTVYARALDVPFDKAAGTRYAAALLSVSSGTCPAWFVLNSTGGGALMKQTPILGGALSGESSLVASTTVGAIAGGTASLPFFVLIP